MTLDTNLRTGFSATFRQTTQQRRIPGPRRNGQQLPDTYRTFHASSRLLVDRWRRHDATVTPMRQPAAVAQHR
ncbi:MAG: hypothetical protein VX346_05480 [Planctomycetota bacterium]|nr:hypothetical protein [Planctomycetota bacterium]